MLKDTVLYQIVDIQISIISAIETISLRKITIPSWNKVKIYTFWKVCYCAYNKFVFKNIDETLFLILSTKYRSPDNCVEASKATNQPTQRN